MEKVGGWGSLLEGHQKYGGGVIYPVYGNGSGALSGVWGYQVYDDIPGVW